MTPAPAYQAGYQMGVVVGIIMVCVFILGFGAFFVFSLVKAITTRRTGWIIATCASSVPFLLFFVLIVVSFVIGFKRGWNHSAEINAARHGDTSPLLTADMTPISGNSIPYQISLPLEDQWQKVESLQQFDHLFAYHDSAYIGVIAEGVGLGTPQHVCDVSQKHIREKASECSFTDPQPIEIDSHSWLTYDVDATISYAHIKYRFYVYADANYTIQIMAWSGPAVFDHEAAVFDRIAKSFKLPQ